ncbi:MAG: Cna B-type domain-containing protein [Sarcina sp.]|nr:Cna B-type domain-containing protein [Sarcina sp.]
MHGKTIPRSGKNNLSRRFWARAVSLMIALVLVLTSYTLSPLTVSAVTGSQVAADGVYSTGLTASKYKYGKLDKTYTGTLNVAVSDGEIAGLWVSNASSDKMSKLITNEIYYTYVGQEASVSKVNAVTGTDAVSSASVAGSSSSVNSSVKKQYVADIKGAIVTALGKASARSSSTSDTPVTAVKTVQGTALVSDSEGSKLVLDVGLDSDGKIVSLTVNDASVSDWSSTVSKNAESYIGKKADQIDTVSGATQYTTAVNTAVIAAMNNANTAVLDPVGTGGDTEPTADNSGSTDAGKTISPDGSATIAVGETVTLDGTHNSMASSESWDSSNDAVATVTASGGSYDSDATVTGVGAGTATITHTINSMFGSSTEIFTITVTGSGSGSGSGSGEGSGSADSDPATGVTSIKVTKEWKNDSASDRPSSVTVGVYNGSTKVQTLTLNSSNSWTATATGLNASISYTVKEDAVEGYTSAVTKGEDTTSDSGASGWTAQSYGAVEAGKTYAFTYTSNGTTYLLGRSGTTVVGTTSGLTGGVPNPNIGNDYKWTVSAANDSRYGDWYLKNNGNNYYLAVGNNYSTGYQPGSYLNSSASSYYGAMHLDDDGSVWNGYSPGYNLYASGTSVGADSNSFTVFTPYLYTEGSASAKTANYTITNTKDDSSSGTGGGTGGNEGGEEQDPADPAHVKAISPEDAVAEEYNITLNVTGQSKTTTSTTQTGESTTSPYDILLVLDNTYSMTTSYGSTTRLAAMKSAAQTFVNDLPTADGAKIAMVSFIIGDRQSPTTTNVNWTDLSTGKSTVRTQIGQLTAPDSQYGYDTCFTQPLERASSLLDSVANDGNKKYVVFFTDGAATEGVSAIQSLAATVKGKADATFSIGIVSGSTETQKAQALASESSNYYDVSDAGTMGNAFTSALSTIQSQTTVSKVPMTNAIITDTLSNYVELVDPDAADKGVSLSASPSDSKVKIDSVTVDNKEVKVALSGNLTDGTVYTVSIPVKPTKAAQDEANENDDNVSSFVSNDGAILTYQYGTEDAKTVDYTEMPKVYVGRQVTLKYDANAGGDKVSDMPETDTKAFTDADKDTVNFQISSKKPAREGYTFLGWDTDKTKTEDPTVQAGEKDYAIEEDTTLYAIWKTNDVTYTLKYDANAGEEEVTVPEDDTYKGSEDSHSFTVSATEPTRTGYTFLGWADSADGDVTYKAGEDGKTEVIVTSDDTDRIKTIYAVWRQDYRIIFEDYTKKQVSIGDVDTQAIDGYEDTCLISTGYYKGNVTFTLKADKAVVAAVHTDEDKAGYDKLMDRTGTYERLYCTEKEGAYEFTVPVNDSDVYIVLAYKGDMNLDADIKFVDAAMADRLSLGTLTNANALMKFVGDVNADNNNVFIDAAMIDRASLGTFSLQWDLAKQSQN